MPCGTTTSTACRRGSQAESLCIRSGKRRGAPRPVKSQREAVKGQLRNRVFHRLDWLAVLIAGAGRLVGMPREFGRACLSGRQPTSGPT